MKYNYKTGIEQHHNTISFPFLGFSLPSGSKRHQNPTLQGINISHLGKRKIILPFFGDMLVPWRVYLLYIYIYIIYLFSSLRWQQEFFSMQNQICRLPERRWSLRGPKRGGSMLEAVYCHGKFGLVDFWVLLLMEEILHQLICSLSHYLQGLCIPGGAGFCPSTVWTPQTNKGPDRLIFRGWFQLGSSESFELHLGFRSRGIPYTSSQQKWVYL